MTCAEGQAARVVEVNYWVVITFRDGKVLRDEWFADRAEALEAVGLSEYDARAGRAGSSVETPTWARLGEPIALVAPGGADTPKGPCAASPDLGSLPGCPSVKR